MVSLLIRSRASLCLVNIFTTLLIKSKTLARLGNKSSSIHFSAQPGIVLIEKETHPLKRNFLGVIEQFIRNFESDFQNPYMQRTDEVATVKFPEFVTSTTKEVMVLRMRFFGNSLKTSTSHQTRDVFADR